MANIDAIKIPGSLLNSGALSRGSGSNILGSLIGAMTGAGQPGGSQSGGGGLGDLVGGMLGGGQARGGQSTPKGNGGGLGDLLGMAMRQFGAAQQGNLPQARAMSPSSPPMGVPPLYR